MLITRNQTDTKVEAAKVTLKRRNWNYRDAAKHLGYSYTHFAYVLSYRRKSKILLAQISALPIREKKTKGAGK